MAREDGYYWNRIGAVELLSREKGRIKRRHFLTPDRYDGLNFRFNVTFNSDLKQGNTGHGTVGILGLSADTIRQWASAELPGDLRKKQMFIRVYAGYEKDGALEDCEIFTLPYIGAIPTSPPEMWLNFNCPDQKNAIISPMVLKSPFMGERVSIKQMFEMLVKTLDESVNKENKLNHVKLKWNIDAETEKRLPMVRTRDYSATRLYELIYEVNSWGLVWARSSNKFNARTGAETINVWVSSLPGYLQNTDDPQTEDDPVVISADTGMIGFPSFGEGSGTPQVTVKCLMRHDISIGDLISVKSQFMKAPYAAYRVNEVSYSGEFRGQEWYVTYKAQAEGVDSKQN